MFDNTNTIDKFCERGDVIDSKIRKFFYELRDKEVERDLRVTVSVVTGDIAEDQKILIELTNDSNPVFLFLLCITQTDFDNLRSDQGINVDYKDFPSALVNLLDKCAEEVCLTNNRAFKLILEDYCGTTSGGCLINMKKIKIKILEECAFKNMCHLTLDFLHGSEGQIQKKLEMELIKTKQCLLQESRLHDEALQKISELVEEINERNKDVSNLNRLIDDLKDEKEEDSKKNRLIAEQKEKLLQEEYETKHCQEREQFQKKLDESQTKMQVLEEEMIRINEKQLKMTSQILEKVKEVETTKTELAVAKQEVSVLQHQNSKLDFDYHEKEKAVNILRTRLAVTEQELKDNNILLIDYQKKLDEASREKFDLQKNLDFIQSKLDKKESVVLNLSEELLKANEIISKQQTKISTLTARQRECEEIILEKQKLVEEKENILVKNLKDNANLLEDLDKEKKNVLSISEKMKSIENNLKEKNDKLENALKVVKIMKENVQNCNSMLRSKSSEKSLLFYRSFLSTPCLLPSDDIRRIKGLKEHRSDIFNNSDLIFTKKSSSASANIIEPYIDRYLKRFIYIPSSLFRSSNIPITVLSSSNGIAVSQAICNPPFAISFGDPPCDSRNNIRNANEYLAYSSSDHFIHSKVPSNSSFDSQDNSHHLSVKACCSSESYNSADKISKICPQSGDCNSNYVPVGAFRLGPAVRHYNNSFERQSRRMKETPGSLKSPLRKTPAISAPPLTPHFHKGAKESVDDHSQIHRSKSRQNYVPPQNLNPLNIHISDSTETILRRQFPYQRMSGSKVMNVGNSSNVTRPLKKIQEHPEPSAYFVS